jgi:DNA-binding NarL/FixJ family response regulator
VAVVTLTADPNPALHRAMIAAGAYDCVVKTDNPDRIVGAVLDAARAE